VDSDDGEGLEEEFEHEWGEEELEDEWAEEETRGRRRKRSVGSELSIEPPSLVGSSFGSNSKAESDSNTDLSFPRVQLKKQRMFEEKFERTGALGDVTCEKGKTCP
jgi:hypothetical protein